MPRLYYPLIKEPIWMDVVKSQIGIHRSTLGTPINPNVSKYNYGASIEPSGNIRRGDQWNFCSWGTAWALRMVGLRGPEVGWALHFVDYGTAVSEFPYGAILVNKGASQVTGVTHVSFVHKKIDNATITLGFNQWVQGVTYQIIHDSNVVAVRWPTEENLLELPLGYTHPHRKDAATDRQVVRSLSSDILVTVGPGGQFETINNALKYLSQYRLVHENKAVILLRTGFVMQEQVLSYGVDWSWVRIEGEDTETVISRSALLTSFREQYPAFGVDDGGSLPSINQLFQMDGTGTATNRHGFLALGAGSRLEIWPGAGCEDAGSRGIQARGGAVVNAQYGIFTGAGVIGVQSLHGSRISIQNANVSGCGSYGVTASWGGYVNAQDANCQRGGSPHAHDIAVETGGIINANGATGGANATTTPTNDGIIFGK